MLKSILAKILNKKDNPINSKSNQKKLKQYNDLINITNHYEQELMGLDDVQLKEKIELYKKDLTNPVLFLNLNSITKKKELKQKLDDLAYCLALIRESSKRLLGLRPYNVQLIGATVLINNAIAEMKTGEGKTLVAAISAIYQAIHKKQVVVLTVNDYLSKRDMELLHPLYSYWGLTVAHNPITISKFNFDFKKEIYQSDIIYSTSSEFCFDYLRINYAKNENEVFDTLNYFDEQERNSRFIIIDEADSILIDQANSPLILSEKVDTPVKDIELAKQIADGVLIPSKYDNINNVFEGQHLLSEIMEIEKLSYQTEEEILNNRNEPDGDFYYDKATRSINIFESGYKKIEDFLLKNNFILKTNDLYSIDNHFMQFITAALQAKYGYEKDVDYLIKDDQIVIIDANTGRLNIGNRWSKGLHHAIECKENVPIQSQSRHIASVTYQNFFNLFTSKSGMTGTAYTEHVELKEIYNLDVVIIPTNKPVVRVDHDDLIFITKKAKYNYLKDMIVEKHQKGQPLLIGTPSVQVSEEVEKVLSSLGFKYELLNAKNHEREAEIIANAGKCDAITIATNMAGRGTDIILGGKLEENTKVQLENWQNNRNKVIQVGGLCVIGIDKNEHKRIDHQLLGRAGRQGEVGESVFLISLEDSLITDNLNPNFLDRVINAINNSPIDKEKVLNSNNALIGMYSVKTLFDNVQKQIAKKFFDYRKNTLKFDNILHTQRSAFYKIRKDMVNASQKEVQKYIEEYFYQYLDYKMSLSEVSFEDDDFIKKLIQQIHEYNGYTEKKIIDFIYVELNNKINTLQSMFDSGKTQEELIHFATNILIWIYNTRWNDIKVIEGQKSKENFEKTTILDIMDNMWSELLDEIDNIKKSSYLSVYAKKNPIETYRQEVHQLFMNIIQQIPVQTIVEISKHNMDINLIDLSNLQDYQFSKEISEMTKEELEEELRSLTSQLLKAEQLKLNHEQQVNGINDVNTVKEINKDDQVNNK